ncbi:MAG: agmatinase family protein [Pseudomonadales bacterium]|jgi:agmatinase|nr:arginase [Gammaproteobacteria bacterium]MDP6028255.1 agmatinase family protein [Pseudomonadales bacterium]MDP6315280.1 agmatinase family protein [Pseudomonadales bacterium]|tara:strand:- start:6311 stop:7501 length:1191 start_codon:yes stop_codon:yes gene_type:complete
MKLLILIVVATCTCFSASAADEPPARYIPLDPNDPTIDEWTETRDLAADKREPGLIEIQRYPGGYAYTGIPSFFNLPVALTPADLKAGKVDVAMMGAPLDTGSGMRGAAWGPRHFRIANNYLPWGSYSTEHLHTMVNWREDLVVVDYGDAAIDNLSGERSMKPVREIVRQIAATGAIPIIIGGDHSLEYPNVAGVADVHGKANVGVIHFDAHFDAGLFGNGHLITHGKPIRRLIEEGHVLGRNYIQVGLRGYWPGKDGFEWMREQGMRYHTMAEVEQDGWPAVMASVLKEAREGTKYLYISLDIDVLDPAYAPGTGTPEPGGLTSRELFPLIRGLCSDNHLVGFDLVEFNPLVDPGYITGLNAERAVRECLTGIAMNRRGLKSGYLSPLTKEDARQ